MLAFLDQEIKESEARTAHLKETKRQLCEGGERGRARLANDNYDAEEQEAL